MAAAKNPRNQWSDKAWREAIRVAVNVPATDDKGKTIKGKKLAQLATKLVEAGIAGDIAALKEIGDRLDGRPAQIVEHTGEGGGPVVISWQPPSA